MVELIVYGIILGSIIALGAIGLSLVYGILRFANFAHGDLMTVGAYLVLFLVSWALPFLGLSGSPLSPLSFGWPLLVGLVVAMPLTGLVALGIDRALYRPMRLRRVSPIILAMTSLAMALILRSLIYIAWGPQFLFYTTALRPAWRLPLGVRIKPDQVFILALVAILATLLYLFLQRTRMGKAMRATADNPQLALVSGIDTGRVIDWTWMLGAGLAAAAGVLYGIEAQLRPEMGWNFLLPLFAAVILGGIGNPFGALVGGLILGIAQQVSTAYLLPTYKPAVAFLLMIVILLVRPRGIFGAT
ncbi:MAG: branched-chain amino acid ABC transporter permease [Candidatus Methylomirabilia bacterium]